VALCLNPLQVSTLHHINKSNPLYCNSGAFGIPGYALKGIYEEVQKTRGLDVENGTVEAQMLQGFREWEAATEEERNLIFVRSKREIEDLETLES
jgi:hypothetical protein